VVTGFQHGAIIGMDHARRVTTDLSKDGAKPYAHLTIVGNRIGMRSNRTRSKCRDHSYKEINPPETILV
jgi:hypothetical protein